MKHPVKDSRGRELFYIFLVFSIKHFKVENAGNINFNSLYIALTKFKTLKECDNWKTI